MKTVVDRSFDGDYDFFWQIILAFGKFFPKLVLKV